MRMVPIEFAQDLYTAENIYDTAGRMLIKAGATLTGRVCDLLKTMAFFPYTSMMITVRMCPSHPFPAI